MNEPERRREDSQIGALRQELHDFIGRYERDSSAAADDRKEVLRVINSHDAFIRDIKPVYNRTMMGLGAIILGSIGIAVHSFWSHIKWG